MHRPLIASALALSLLAASAAAQELKNFGGNNSRAETSLFVAEMTKGEFSGVHGAMFVTYGQPEWKKEWTAETIDTQTKGKVFRLGKDNWATLDISCPVSIGGTTVPAGVWYLAISRSKDGATWSLVVIDPAKAKAAGAWPFNADAAPRAYEIKLNHETTKDVTQKLTIALEPAKDNAAQATLSIAWGNYKVSAAVEVKGSKSAPKDAAGKK